MGIGKLKKSNKASIQSFRSRKEVEWKAFKNGDDNFFPHKNNKKIQQNQAQLAIIFVPKSVTN